MALASNYTKFRVGNVFVTDTTCLGMYYSVIDSSQSSNAILSFSMNGEGIANYNVDKDFKDLIDQADIVHADGWSTMMAGRLFTKGNYLERVATTDCYKNILQAAVAIDYMVYFVGASKVEIEKAVDFLKLEFPSLKVAGYQDGYFSNIEDVILDINLKKAELVIIGLGRPLQERAAIEIKDSCKNVKYIKTCGGLFNFLSGKNPRAPLLLQKIGLEWLFRLANEPSRLFYRYLWSNTYCIYLYLFYSGNHGPKK